MEGKKVMEGKKNQYVLIKGRFITHILEQGSTFLSLTQEMRMERAYIS